MKRFRILLLAVSMLFCIGPASAQWTVFDPTQAINMGSSLGKAGEQLSALANQLNQLKKQYDFAYDNYKKLQTIPRFVSDMRQVAECAIYIKDIANNMRLGYNDLNAGLKYFSSREKKYYLVNFAAILKAANGELAEMGVVARGKGGSGSEMNAAERMRLIREIHERLSLLRAQSARLRYVPNRIIYARSSYDRQVRTMKGILGDMHVTPININGLKY